MTIPTPAAELRRIRLALGLSQAALADRLGCQQQHLSDWERGVREPRSSILLRVQAMEREKRTGEAK